MMPRLAGLLGLVVLAASTAACTNQAQTPVREAIDYSDYGAYDRAFGASPGSDARNEGRAIEHVASNDDALRPAADEGAPSRGAAAGNAAIGFSTGAQHVRQDVTETEYVQVEATPGTACYDAAVQAGIQTGTCTLISERKYVLVGEKAR